MDPIPSSSTNRNDIPHGGSEPSNISSPSANLFENKKGSSSLIYERAIDHDTTAHSEDSDSQSNIEEAENLEDIDPEGFAGPSEKIVKPLTAEDLAAFNAAVARSGVIYISRIPPGMRPAKVRHLMSAHGEVGRVYLKQEDAKRAFLRKKFTSTKKPHFIEGWVEFKDKKIARTVAEMLNAQPIGGKKGSRWRDDVWTIKYLPKFKWNMLTEQIAHEAAVHTARLRMELTRSREEQHDYLRKVELARILDKRSKRKHTKEPSAGDNETEQNEDAGKRAGRQDERDANGPPVKRRKQLLDERADVGDKKLLHVLASIF